MTDKIALVTGAARGIGRGIAVALAARGWGIVVNYRGNADAAAEALRLIVQAGGRGIIVQGDVAVTQDRERLVAATLEHFGHVDLLVNNAGMAPRVRTDMLQVGEASYDEVMATNLKGPFFLTQLVARKMIELKTPNAKIVNIGSLSAYASSPNRAEYCVSKAGVAMMTALFADRLAEYGINVYEIRPGIIETDLTSVVKAKYDKLIAEGLLPIKHWGQPDDVARAVVAIAEDALPYSTGEVINVDGGFHLRRL
ncbi:MAG: 3-ketoacyl-ACP reductase [Chloroflexi bacterium]|nr:3-ketoacyl-ACP reductase [Chloroflexota bacterium]